MQDKKNQPMFNQCLISDVANIDNRPGISGKKKHSGVKIRGLYMCEGD